jgi:hypothetical protein
MQNLVSRNSSLGKVSETKWSLKKVAEIACLGLEIIQKILGLEKRLFAKLLIFNFAYSSHCIYFITETHFVIVDGVKKIKKFGMKAVLFLIIIDNN